LLAAFVSLDETEATMSTLGWFVLSISTLVWILAALCARWLSRKTLVPLTRLVESARSLDATNPGWTLAEVGSRDELDELRRAFNDLLTRLHVAYDRQKRFSSEASHQLRTPVAVMIGHLEVALRHERCAEHYGRVVQLVYKRAVELGHIVESLLFLSRADSSTLTRAEPLDLNEWLLGYMDDRPTNDRTDDILVNTNNTARLWINAQSHLLGQMLENLLDNACKYSPPGTSILLSTTGAGASAVLAVEDSGSGIAPGDLAQIFEPFFRGTAVAGDGIPGIGLGLSVVKRVVDAFGGTIVADSRLGSGSRFEVRFPITAAPVPEASAPLSDRRLVVSAVPSAPSDRSQVELSEAAVVAHLPAQR
jgi:signal transduction histidine kinase